MQRVARRITMAVIAVALITTPAFAGDTSSNAMIYNGVTSKQQLIAKIQQGDGTHTAKNLQEIYSNRGVSIAEIKSTNTVNGTVTKSGEVIVDGKVVATDAKSYGRQYIQGSTKSGSLYVRSTSVSFASSQLDAYVYIRNGKFQWAIIKDCGNIVTATPKTPAPKPKTKPVANKTVINVVQTQSQAQAQTPTPATPVAAAVATPAAAQAEAEAPATLPDTGAKTSAALAGLSLMIVGTYYYLRRNSDLRNAILARVRR